MFYRRLIMFFAVAAIWLIPIRIYAQMVCRVSLLPVTFGTYLPWDLAPLDVAGSVDVSCRGQPGTFQVTISTGSSATYLSREMVFGTFLMRYNIFADSARTLVWGDGTGGSVVNAGTKPRPGRQDFSFPAYGRVIPQQNVSAGTYVDDVVVTVMF